MVAEIAKGEAAVQYGANPIPTDGVDTHNPETTAESLFSRVFSAFRPRDVSRQRWRGTRARHLGPAGNRYRCQALAE